MTKFVKERFRKDGAYLTYLLDESSPYYNPGVAGINSGEKCRGKFVARFKYQRSAAGTFQTFLIKNFTVEEYFDRMAAGEAPLTILESKGYILPHIKKWLKEGGYPVTQAGYKQYLNDTIAQSAARFAKVG